MWKKIFSIFLGCLVFVTARTSLCAIDNSVLVQNANQGDPKAELLLGEQYLFANGAAKDAQKGSELLEKAAEYGTKNPAWPWRADAYAMLGIAYESDPELKNPATAIRWYREAAMLNDPRGQTGLSRIYSYGGGEVKNVVEALAWTYIVAQSGAPGTVNNDGIPMLIHRLEQEAGEKGTAQALTESKALIEEIKKNSQK